MRIDRTLEMNIQSQKERLLAGCNDNVCILEEKKRAETRAVDKISRGGNWTATAGVSVDRECEMGEVEQELGNWRTRVI